MGTDAQPIDLGDPVWTGVFPSNIFRPSDVSYG